MTENDVIARLNIYNNVIDNNNNNNKNNNDTTNYFYYYVMIKIIFICKNKTSPHAD